MNWFRISPTTLLPFSCKSDAFRYAIERQISVKHIKPVRMGRLPPNACLKLFEHILHNLNSGHSLQSALMKQNHLQYNADLRQHVLAIQSLLAEGDQIAHVLTIFMPHNIMQLAGSIPLDGTEESKVAGLEIARDILRSQQTLSHKLLKSLLYPCLVIQASLLLALMNGLLTKQPLFTLGSLWCLISLLQIVFSIWIYRGHAYPALCRLLRGFRTYNSLMLLIALLQSGETLQGAVQKLLQTSHNQDRLHLYRCYLLLQAGKPIQHALPAYWFNQQLKTQLEQIHMTGDLVTPLTIAANTWHNTNQRILNLVSKAFPILGIVVAAVFVTQTLMALYAPLMDANAFGF